MVLCNKISKYHKIFNFSGFPKKVILYTSTYYPMSNSNIHVYHKVWLKLDRNRGKKNFFEI